MGALRPWGMVQRLRSHALGVLALSLCVSASSAALAHKRPHAKTPAVRADGPRTHAPRAKTPRGSARVVSGPAVLVEWDGSFWPAHVIGPAKGGQFHVAYDGFGPEWDETVDLARMARRDPGAPPPPSVGDAIFVEWGGSFWPAVVLSKPGGKLKIRYDGYDASYDEVVDATRLVDIAPFIP